LRYYDPVLLLLQPRLKQISPTLGAVYLKALFNLGRMNAFGQRWEELHDRVKEDPELPLYNAAYQVGWGPPDHISEARQRLEEGSQDPKLRNVASRLKLALSLREINPGEYAKTLKQLEEWREDTLSQHTAYWRLLQSNGRQTEAVQLAEDYARPPDSAFDAAEL